MFNKRAKKFRALDAAIAADDPQLADIGYFEFRDCYEAAKRAGRQNAQKVFTSLLNTRMRGRSTSFLFDNAYAVSQNLARKLLTETSGFSDPDGLWDIMHKASANADKDAVRLADADFLTPHAPLDFIGQMLEKNRSLFKSCVENIGLADTAKLKFILSLAPEEANTQIVLNGALIKTAGTGDAEKTRLLLDAGADADYADGMALKCAVEKGHDGVADMLRAAPRKPVAKPGPQTPAGLPLADALVEQEALPGGGTLTTVFNFRTRQQHNVLTAPDGTKLMTTVGFRQIEKEVIAAAEKRYEERNARPAAGDGLAAKGLAKKFKGTGLT